MWSALNNHLRQLILNQGEEEVDPDLQRVKKKKTSIFENTLRKSPQVSPRKKIPKKQRLSVSRMPPPVSEPRLQRPMTQKIVNTNDWESHSNSKSIQLEGPDSPKVGLEEDINSDSAQASSQNIDIFSFEHYEADNVNQRAILQKVEGMQFALPTINVIPANGMTVAQKMNLKMLKTGNLSIGKDNPNFLGFDFLGGDGKHRVESSMI